MRWQAHQKQSMCVERKHIHSLPQPLPSWLAHLHRSGIHQQVAIGRSCSAHARGVNRSVIWFG